MTSSRSKQRGGALLAVLWLSAALAAIAFSVANTVRTETDRTATGSEGLRTAYLAAGAVERGILYMSWGAGHRNPDGSPRYYEPGLPMTWVQFPSGTARIEFIPEFAKLNINRISGEELTRLLVNLGTAPPRAVEIAAAILDWRTPGGPSEFDHFYLSLTPSFRARHASFEEVEELLLVKGMTPELYHGSFTRDAQGRLAARGGLKDCVSVYGSNGAVDANYADPAVLATIGITPVVIPVFVERRRAVPFRRPEQLNELAQLAGPGFGRLRIGGENFFTVRATAALHLSDGRYSDVRRTASALISLKADSTPPYQVLRWYEH